MLICKAENRCSLYALSDLLLEVVNILAFLNVSILVTMSMLTLIKILY